MVPSWSRFLVNFNTAYIEQPKFRNCLLMTFIKFMVANFSGKSNPHYVTDMISFQTYIHTIIPHRLNLLLKNWWLPQEKPTEKNCKEQWQKPEGSRYQYNWVNDKKNWGCDITLHKIWWYMVLVFTNFNYSYLCYTNKLGFWFHRWDFLYHADCCWFYQSSLSKVTCNIIPRCFWWILSSSYDFCEGWEFRIHILNS